ncbi:MAG: NAD(P)H-dependent oxidoreductase [Bacteroidota bacterium]|nr:NAD(P)H-dependent oxidoreductase [Bacteroidota bacterium]
MQTSVLKNILAIPGSLRTSSSNHAILNYLGTLAPANSNFSIFEGLAQIPHFDPGLDNDNPPETVTAFRKLIDEADGVIICSPEYAYGVPGTLKNALDWTVSSGSLSEKPLALITASTGGENAHAALLLILTALNAKVRPDSALIISFIRSKMDENGNITDEAEAKRLNRLFEIFLASL